MIYLVVALRKEHGSQHSGEGLRVSGLTEWVEIFESLRIHGKQGALDMYLG